MFINCTSHQFRMKNKNRPAAQKHPRESALVSAPVLAARPARRKPLAERRQFSSDRPPETAEAETRPFWRRNWDCETCSAAAASSPSGHKVDPKKQKSHILQRKSRKCEWGRVRRLRVKFFRKCRTFFLLQNKDFIGDERKILYECGKTKGRKI